MNPKTLLFVLVGVVPVVVVAAGAASFLMLRSGYGMAVSLGVPFVVSLALVAGLGALLGRAASRRGRDGGRSGGPDDV